MSAPDAPRTEGQGACHRRGTAFGLKAEEEAIPTYPVVVGRVYDEPNATDGARILVDRIWPRGLSKERAHLDEWCTEVAPSTALRKWYGHVPDRFDEFATRYREELTEPNRAAALQHLRELAANGPVTLLTATKRPDISEATVLAPLLTL